MEIKRTKSLLVTSLVAFFSSVLLLGIVVYILNQKEMAVAYFEEEARKIQEEGDADAVMKYLLADTKASREEIDKYFIGKDNVVSFIESIEKLAVISSTEVSVNNVAIEEIKDSSLFQKVVIQGTSIGSFKNLYWFLSLIESIPMKTEIRQVYIEKMISEDESKKTEVWRLAFVIEAYKLK